MSSNTYDMNYNNGLYHEWIITNGIGGYASSTLTLANSRTYHGLLIASLNPPVDRTLLLSSIDEIITINDQDFELAVHKYPGVVHPQGNKYLTSVQFTPSPIYNYEVNNIIINKRIFMHYGHNTTIIEYEIDNNVSEQEVSFKLIPLTNSRNFHHTSNAKNTIIKQSSREYGTDIFTDVSNLYLDSNIEYVKDPYWFYNFEYECEIRRGTGHLDDNFNPGYFKSQLKKGKNHIFIVASTKNESDWSLNDIKTIYENETERQKQIEHSFNYYKDPFISQLYPAIDSFLVSRRSTNSLSLIAGYHWFSDWGRDSMISLPGLTLVTGRYDAARSILKTFSQYCNDGLIPNQFSDNSTKPPAYNTVDAPLWFIHAAMKYYEYTKDIHFLKDIWATLENIIGSYINGTHYDIKMDDDDGLLSHGPQLTWMDAMIGDTPVTPREGKAVEVNALWYNSLNIALDLSHILDKEISISSEDIKRTKKAFQDKFWNNNKNCLFDTIGYGVDNHLKDDSIRPNQIFSISLPYKLLDVKKSRGVLNNVCEELLTPFGLRTLSPKDTNYQGRYHGDHFQRDKAYHNGTVWPWLMGPFISAYTKMNSHSQSSIEFSKELVLNFEPHLLEACIGSISEIFDGDYPHLPRGCVSQSWSVAEVLRAYVEDIVPHYY
ncbi:glycogen debranching protein [Methanosalsum natronophilum]|uniref:Glycogen debranching protein n=1 Tax=Methanosalsum natronophilum TaxID=768733 RepID=A0A3R7VU70_9EURY|nr:MAG: glycogen debranching protein [Methanosalsum natronophilum]